MHSIHVHSVFMCVSLPSFRTYRLSHTVPIGKFYLTSIHYPAPSPPPPVRYYHLPSVHPELTEVSGIDEHSRLQGPGSYVGFKTYPLTSAGTPLDPDVFPAFASLKGEAKTTAYFHHVFPNLFWFCFPHHNFAVITTPSGPTTSVEHAALMVDPAVRRSLNINTMLRP